MSFALLGSIALQAYWITGAIRINEEQFDKSIFDVLRQVSERIEREESEHNSRLTDFVLRSRSGETLSEEDLLNTGLDIDETDRLDSIYRYSKSLFKKDETGEEKLFNENRRRNMIESMLAHSIYSYKPLEERINAESLNDAIRKELRNAGLQDIKINYGIFSNQLKALVIKNGHYVVETKPIDPVLSQAFDFLQNTKYKIDMFSTREAQSPGYLALYFPTRTSLVWSSVWSSLLGSIIFTSITLFCFAYTISTIFRQKKLGDIKNDFINNMTHEFKTPIATISLSADTILSPTILNNPDKVKRFVEIIKQENKRMNGQVEKVLQAAIVDREKLKLKLVEIDLHEIIEQATDNFSVQIESREGQLHTDLQANNSIVEGDLTHISNIIHNLMDNANKYSPEHPDITVRTKNVSGGVEISIADKGVGLSPSSRKLIFDKFYRVPTGNLHDVKGFGLGLSYVKAMVTAHKGTIEVKSELGKGSTFIIFLPFKVIFSS